MSDPTLQLNKFFSTLQSVVKAAVKPLQMRYLANETIKIVVKRTKLGYGVLDNGGERDNFDALSTKYIRKRKNLRSQNKKHARRGHHSALVLDASTNPEKSNLTFTGQMLRSLAYEVKDGEITIKPEGTRDDGLRNYDVAQWCSEKGRTFNRMSRAEENQVFRIYRKRFGDLLGRLSLIR